MDISTVNVNTIKFEGITAEYMIYYKTDIPSNIDIDEITEKLTSYISTHCFDDSYVNSVRKVETEKLYELFLDPLYIEIIKCKRNIKSRLEKIIHESDQKQK